VNYQPIGASDVNCFEFPVGTAHQLLLDEMDDWTKLFVLGVASDAPSECAVCGFVNKNPCAMSQPISIVFSNQHGSPLPPHTSRRQSDVRARQHFDTALVSIDPSSNSIQSAIDLQFARGKIAQLGK
jgi:hypothetical protein